MGTSVPPAVRPLPVAASRSFNVVVTTIDTGSPLCWPRSPEAKRPRSAASNPSWLRWAADRVSRRTASSSGVASTTGVSSSGLHAPGAASLASMASMAARNSGVSRPLMRDMPSNSCLPRVMPRLRARSASLNSPSGCSQSMIRWAYLANSSGRYPAALPARSASAACRVGTSTSAGRWAKKLRITLTCPSPISPSRWPAAVALSCGANGSPVSARSSPRSWASSMRRPASPW